MDTSQHFFYHTEPNASTVATNGQWTSSPYPYAAPVGPVASHTPLSSWSGPPSYPGSATVIGGAAPPPFSSSQPSPMIHQYPQSGSAVHLNYAWPDAQPLASPFSSGGVASVNPSSLSPYLMAAYALQGAAVAPHGAVPPYYYEAQQSCVGYGTQDSVVSPQYGGIYDAHGSTPHTYYATAHASTFAPEAGGEYSAVGDGVGHSAYDGESAEWDGGGVLGTPGLSFTADPTMAPPQPLSVASSSSSGQESYWRHQCLTVRCSMLPRETEKQMREIATQQKSRSSRVLSPSQKKAKVEKSSSCANGVPGRRAAALQAPSWDALVWRWLSALGMASDVAEVFSPGGRRVLVTWVSDEAAMRWRARAEAVSAHASPLTVFEGALLSWS